MKQPADQAVGSRHLRQHRLHLGRGKPHRQALGRSSPGSAPTPHPSRHRQVRQESLNLTIIQLTRMALAKVIDESSNPIDIGLLCTNTVVLDTDLASNLVKQPWRRRTV